MVLSICGFNWFLAKKVNFEVVYAELRVKFFKEYLLVYNKMIYGCKAGFMGYLLVLFKHCNNSHVISIIGNNVNQVAQKSVKNIKIGSVNMLVQGCKKKLFFSYS